MQESISKFKADPQSQFIPIALIIVSLFIYFTSIAILYANRFNPFISVRSEKLLQMGNFGIFLTVISHLIKEIINHFSLDYFIIVFHFLMMISLLFRFFRIIICTQITFPDDDLTNLNSIKTKRYHYEFIYMRYLLISTFALFALLLLYYFICPISHRIENQLVKLAVWLAIHSIDLFALITVGFSLAFRAIGYYIKAEYWLGCLTLYAYFFITDFMPIYFYTDDSSHYSRYSTYYHVGFLLALLLFNTSFPLLAKLFNKKNHFYKFPPELTSDLYLYLSNEDCFDHFNQYLLNSFDNQGVFLLELYLKLIRLKLMFHKEGQSLAFIGEVGAIFSEYYSLNAISDYILQVDKEDIQKKYSVQMENTDITFELFNGGLTSCFKYLLEKFRIYQQTADFLDLQNRIRYETYIQAKLCSSGLLLLNRKE